MEGLRMSEHRHNQFEIEVNTPPEGFKASLKSRIIVALVLIAIFVPSFILGGWVFFFVFMAALVIALTEMLLAPQKKYRWWVWVFTFLVAFGYVYWFILKGNLIQYEAAKEAGEVYVFSLAEYFDGLDISIINIATSLIGYFVIALFDKNFEFKDVMYFFLLTALVGLGMQGFYFARYFPFNQYGHSQAFQTYTGLNINGITGPEVIQTAVFQYWTSAELEIFVLLGVVFNDVMAYFGGVYFGKHKMIERISPKKTWEGFFWGWFFGALICALFGLGTAFFGSPMLPFLDLEHWYWVVGLALLIPLLGDLGDLAFSLIKRHFNIKDYGNILRGHGGVLDRADSSIFAMIGVSIALIFISHGFNFLL